MAQLPLKVEKVIITCEIQLAGVNFRKASTPECAVFAWHSSNEVLLWDRQIQLELSRQFFLGIEAIGEVDSPDSAVGVDLNK